MPSFISYYAMLICITSHRAMLCFRDSPLFLAALCQQQPMTNGTYNVTDDKRQIRTVYKNVWMLSSYVGSSFQFLDLLIEQWENQSCVASLYSRYLNHRPPMDGWMDGWMDWEGFFTPRILLWQVASPIQLQPGSGKLVPIDWKTLVRLLIFVWAPPVLVGHFRPTNFALVFQLPGAGKGGVPEIFLTNFFSANCFFSG